MERRVLIILGHPNARSFCGALADAYEKGASQAGAQVRRLNLGELEFDLHMRAGYSGEQTLEPALEAAQRDIAWADHLVFVYPTWWGTMPALLKGFIDRTFVPGFAFKYRQGNPLPAKLLGGRSARLITTMDAPPAWYYLVVGAPGHKAMKRATLHFCGIKPVRVTSLGPVRGSSDSRRRGWLEKVQALGRKVR